MTIKTSWDVCFFKLTNFCALFSVLSLLCLPGASSDFRDDHICSVWFICLSSFREPYLDMSLAFSRFFCSAILERALPSSSFGALPSRRSCDKSDSNFRDAYIELSPVSSTFFCLPGACPAFHDLQIDQI
jgi:hypothetical protein